MLKCLKTKKKYSNRSVWPQATHSDAIQMNWIFPHFFFSACDFIIIFVFILALLAKIKWLFVYCVEFCFYSIIYIKSMFQCVFSIFKKYFQPKKNLRARKNFLHFVSKCHFIAFKWDFYMHIVLNVDDAMAVSIRSFFFQVWILNEMYGRWKWNEKS